MIEKRMTPDEIEARISKDKKALYDAWKNLANSAYDDSVVRTAFYSRDDVYNDDLIKMENAKIRHDIWYDRKLFGDPIEQYRGETFDIIVRYFEAPTNKFDVDLESCLAIDAGYWWPKEMGEHHGWMIENDWDECSMNVEILAYRIHDVLIPDEYLELPKFVIKGNVIKTESN